MIERKIDSVEIDREKDRYGERMIERERQIRCRE